MNYESRVTQVTVAPKDASLFADSVTKITIEDEGGGEFVEIQQIAVNEGIRIDPAEWPAMQAAIGRMITACREVDNA